MNNYFFEVSIENLKKLEEKDAVKCFKSLLQAEIYSYNIPANKVQITENTKEADGGIDAVINYSILEKDDGILKNGKVNYQIKADDSFTSLSELAILNELLGKGKKNDLLALPPENIIKRLKPGIIETLKQGKYYVLVVYKVESAGTKKEKAINIIKDIFKKCGYPDAKVDIFDCTNIQLAVNRHPSIVNKISPFPDYIDNILDVLKQGQLNEKFYENEKLAEIRKTFNDFYLKNEDARHIRILGEPGIGKTKAVLEFCRPFNFNTLYIETYDKFDDSGLLDHIKRNKDFNATLIIDECNKNNADYMYNKLKNITPNLRFITIYNDINENISDSETKIIKLPRLSDEDFAKILFNEYGIEKSLAVRISSICEGYPRLAHFIGENYKANQKILNNLDEIMKAIIVGSEQNENKKNKTLGILRYLSIFKKFGLSEKFQQEKEYIFSLIKFEFMDLTKIEFEDIILELKRKKILQQEHTLYISPKILQVWLYSKFWENSARKKQILDSMENFPSSLKQWFGDMFEYIKDADIPVDIPEEFLKTYNYDKILDKSDSYFFLKLTKGNPKAALKVLNNIFNTLSNQEILNIKDSRMNLIWSLQYILFDKSLFLDAVKILYRLAVNENETVYSNNATGIFQRLFHIYLPGTETCLETRKNILKNFYNNAKTENEIILLIKAFDSALKTCHFSRMGGPETIGFDVKKDYQPKTYKEIFDYYKTVLDLLLDCVSNKQNAIQEEALNVIVDNSTSLIRYSKQTKDLICNVFDILLNIKNLDKSKIHIKICKIIQHLKFNKNDNIKDAIGYFEEIKNRLTKDSPQETIEAYYNIDIWEISENIKETKNIYENFIEKLLKLYQSLEKNKQKELVKKFIDKKYNNDYFYGVTVARNDRNFKLLDLIIKDYKNTQNKESLFFVGYLSELYKTSQEKYDETVKKLYDLKFYDLIVNINHRGCITNLTSKLASLAITNEYVPISKIATFAFNNNHPIDTIKELLFFAISKKTLESISSAIDILFRYKQIWSDENLDLIFKILKSTTEKQNTKVNALIRDSYIWTMVISKFIDQKGDSNEIFELLDDFLGYITQNHNSVYSTQISLILKSCTDINPTKTWQILSKYLNLGIIIFNPVVNWLRGDDSFNRDTIGAMYLFNKEDIFSWIDEDIENRLPIIAQSAPKDLFNNDGEIMRSLLIKYPNNEKLYHYLHINFGNKGWSGKASEYIKNEIEKVKTIKNNESNISVLGFINKYLDSLEKELEYYLIEEERGYQ